jgi:hypothetical protein
MLTIDPTELVTAHRRDLYAEAEQERLAGLLPTRPSAARRGLALICYRVAAWLDAPPGYVELPEAGPEEWVTPWASV